MLELGGGVVEGGEGIVRVDSVILCDQIFAL